MIKDELIRAILQLIVLSLIPFIWWTVSNFHKSETTVSFVKWIGLKKPIIEEKKKFVIFIIISLVVTVSMTLVLDPLLPDDIQLANARFSGKGIQAFIPAIIFAFFATGLPEEIFFRGFLGKRLGNRFGFAVGNTMQAIVFGLLHGATMFSTLGVMVPLLVILYTGITGWLMGYVNEKSDGSILTSWIIHGLANLYAAINIMF